MVAEPLPAPLDMVSVEALMHPASESGDESRTEIIFVDSAVIDADILLKGIQQSDPNIHYQVFFLDADSDGVNQITSVLSEFSGIDAIHLIAHGDNGSIRLGNGELSLD